MRIILNSKQQIYNNNKFNIINDELMIWRSEIGLNDDKEV